MLSAGAHRFQARHDERLVGDVPEVDLEAVVERKDDHVLDWAGHRRDSVHEMAERDDVTFIHDTATFVDEHTVRAGGEEHEADYVVIATGSSVNVPETPGIDEVDFMTSDRVLDATDPRFRHRDGLWLHRDEYGEDVCVPRADERHPETPATRSPNGGDDEALDIYGATGT